MRTNIEKYKYYKAIVDKANKKFLNSEIDKLIKEIKFIPKCVYRLQHTRITRWRIKKFL